MVEVTNYIDRLVAELCPDGVEYRPLGEIADIGTGKSDKKDAQESGQYPFYVRSKTILRSSKYLYDETAIVIPGEGGVGEIFHFVSGKYDLHQRAYRVSFTVDEMNPKFGYYYISSFFKEYINRHAVEATVKSIRKPMLVKFEVPVPPLEIQEAIVEILDKFTNLEAELEAELEARTLQYEYYRNSLFESLKDPVNGLPVIANLVKELCPDGVKYSTLKSVSLKTTNIKWERSEEAEYRYIDLSSVPTGGSSIGDTEIINSENAPSRARQIVHTDDILFGTTRPLLDRVVIVPEEYDRQICSTGYAVIRPDTNVVIPSYIYHILREKNFSAYVEKNQTGAAYPAISFKSVMEYTIPLPPLEIQQRIVDILDRFDALTSSLSEGLPAELAARRSQYEYYRDQLLTFPRKDEDQ